MALVVGKQLAGRYLRVLLLEMWYAADGTTSIASSVAGKSELVGLP
jgi:hypothetical protein